MKNILVACFLIAGICTHAQAYRGKGDQKLQIGANFQDGASGIQGSFDYGLGQNLSIGISTDYALGLNDGIDADFDERAVVRLRLNANLGDVINLSPNFDVYPGISLGSKNFGGHVGARYFFTDGFGLYTEAAFPFAKYKTETLTAAQQLYNQFNFSIGTVFNL
jgi:hypothetical protein